MKQHIYVLIAFALAAMFFHSCEKDSNPVADCFPDASTVREITNAEATIKEAGGKFYVIEKGSIDSKLNPCNLPADFQVNDLPVLVSGEVKSTLQAGPGPCCTENFVIHKISR